jgi:hypothetical protein
MKRQIVTALIAGGLAFTAGAASAQSWRGINDRQDRLYERIERGVDSGALTRREARSLRAEFSDLARLESRYRAGGLSNWERADLDRRFDALSARIRFERRDGQQRYGYGYYR